MRSRERVLVFFAFTTVAVVTGVGCSPPACGDGGEEDARACTNADSSAQSSSSGGNPECIPSDAKGPVGDECGVFVSSQGIDENNEDGTKEKPVKTLAKAVELAAVRTAEARHVYACAETLKTEPAAEIKVPSGVALYGGLNCANGWAYVDGGPKTVVTAPSGTIPLRLLGGNETTRLVDVHVLAEDADALVPGSSSVALMIEGGRAELVRALVEAGAGAKGVAGESYDMPASAGENGADGNDACSAETVVSKSAPKNVCGAVESAGGAGGIGFDGQAGNGLHGKPGMDILPGAVLNGGDGEGSSGCKPGLGGTSVLMPAAPGDDGAGLGMLNASGYTGVAGSPGTAGLPGQGGGGGGGSKGGSGVGTCSDGAKAGGASGGTGASGGCGGAGGKGGGPGGASIALVSLDAEVVFVATTLLAKNGGDGGDGGTGQPGGDGGSKGGMGGKVPAGASNLKIGCPGGRGGDGGPGGLGGRGLGGHSLAVAYTGKALVLEGATPKVGAAGAGGKPIAADTQGFN